MPALGVLYLLPHLHAFQGILQASALSSFCISYFQITDAFIFKKNLCLILFFAINAFQWTVYLFAQICENKRFPLMIWRNGTMCSDLEAHGAHLLWLNHVCHLRSSCTLQKHPCCSGPEQILVSDGEPESWLCLSVVGPWTSHSPSVFPASGDKDSTTSRDCCPCRPQKLGFVIKSCLTWRHSGYNKQKWTVILIQKCGTLM